MSYDLEKFNWGWMNNEENHGQYHKKLITNEIFEQKIYERFFEVSKGDIVLDVGSSVGPFTYSILHKKPKKVFCIEPSSYEHESLRLNTLNESVEIIKTGITKKDGDEIHTPIFGGAHEKVKGTSFKTIVNDLKIDKIDFLKTDCEGGEYDIFNIENLHWLKENLKYCSGEWHLSSPELKHKFREFRDVFLRVFPNHEVFSLCGTNIKWDLWNEHFIEYYNEVIVYIDNS